MFLHCITSFAQFYHEYIQVSPSSQVLYACKSIKLLLYLLITRNYVTRLITNLGTNTHTHVTLLTL